MLPECFWEVVCSTNFSGTWHICCGRHIHKSKEEPAGDMLDQMGYKDIDRKAIERDEDDDRFDDDEEEQDKDNDERN